MAILISFLPWFVFWILLSLRMVEPAAFGAFIAVLIINALDILHKRSLKVLQVGTLVFFLAMAIAALFFDLETIGTWSNFSGNAALALIILISIIIRKPFTLQYAREGTPKEHWETKEFIHANYVITWVWFLALSINTGFSAFRFVYHSMPVWASWVVSGCCFIGAISFTNWYKNRKK